MDYQAFFNCLEKTIPNNDYFRPNLPRPLDILKIITNADNSAYTYISEKNLFIFTDEVINDNRDLLESMFANITIIVLVRTMLEDIIDKSTHSCFIDLLSRASRVRVLGNQLNTCKWLRDINIFSLEGDYDPNLNFKILVIHAYMFESEPLYNVRFVRHYSRIDCKKLFPNLIYCISCRTSNYPTIILDDSLRITFDPAIITGISDTGTVSVGTNRTVLATSAILDRAIEAYDRFKNRGNHTKRAITSAEVNTAN